MIIASIASRRVKKKEKEKLEASLIMMCGYLINALVFE